MEGIAMPSALFACPIWVSGAPPTATPPLDFSTVFEVQAEKMTRAVKALHILVKNTDMVFSRGQVIGI
jgi:hypothetical protein